VTFGSNPEADYDIFCVEPTEYRTKTRDHRLALKTAAMIQEFLTTEQGPREQGCKQDSLLFPKTNLLALQFELLREPTVCTVQSTPPSLFNEEGANINLLDSREAGQLMHMGGYPCSCQCS